MSLTDEAPRFRIKAGVMNTEEVGGSFRVKPDPRPGYLEITANADEGVLTIGWRTRNAQEHEFSLILTPDSLRFAKVDTGTKGDRVYVLFSKSRERRRFFWLQEPDADGDEAKVKKLREMLKRPPSARASRGGLGGMPGMDLMQAMAAAGRRRGGRGAAPSAASASASASGGGGSGSGGGIGASMPGLAGLGPEEQAMIAQLLGAASDGDEGNAASSSSSPGASAPTTSSSSSAAAPSSATSSSSATSAAAAPASSPTAGNDGDGDDDDNGGDGDDDDDNDDDDGVEEGLSGEQLAQFMAQTQGMPPELQAMLLQQLQARMQPRTAPLSLVANADDALAVATASEDVASSLAALLPEGQRDPAMLEEAIRSPQLRQALDGLSGALFTENFETVFANFGLSPADGAEHMERGDAVGAFLAAIQAQADRETGGSSSSSSSSNADDEEGDAAAGDKQE